MNVPLRKYLDKFKEFWNSRSKKQKIMITAGTVLFIAGVTVTTLLATRTNYVPLYSNLSVQEAASIKESLDGQGVDYQLEDGGTTIKVPEDQRDSILLELSAEGLPETGDIDYSFFSKNKGLGTTDKEFDVMKLDAMQTELANIIKSIDGVKDAKVMITLPDNGIFVSDDENEEEAQAVVMLETAPGYKFDEQQIKGLYNLVSKSVPNLPTDNIVIMNQNFEYYDIDQSENGTGKTFANQFEIKKEIERDIQKQVQNMLGTLMGRDKVLVTVTADIDFKQENREENLVEPVDEENMEGIAVSAQKITETYTGGNAAGGVPQAEDAADALGTTYQEGNTGNGDYEKIEETVNNEVNKIRKEITESPYKIRDLGIQVMVEPPDANDPNSLPQERVDDIQQMLANIVRTTINKGDNEEELTDEDIQNKISVSVQPFNGKVKFNEGTKSVIPWWVYVIGGVLVLVIALLIFLMIRARKKRKEEEEELLLEEEETPIEIPDLQDEIEESESTLRKKQLERMATEHPEDFAKLLRSWLAED